MEKELFLNAVTKMELDIKESYRKQAKVYPCYVNRASEIGHPCERFLFFQRTEYEKKSLPSVELMQIFAGGRLIEELCETELKQAGYKLIEGQRPYKDDRYQLSGHIDGKIEIDGALYPIEIKGINQHDFESLSNVNDFLKSGKSWLMKYPAQLLIYEYLTEAPAGIMYIKSKSMAGFKAIPIFLYDHLDYVESLLKKAERINEAVKTKTKPPQIPYTDNICGYCDFLTTCLPDKEGIELNFQDDPTLEKMLIRYDELKPSKSEYDKIDKELSRIFKGQDRLVIGNYIITGQMIDKKAYEIPEDIQRQYEKNKPYWKKTIKAIGKE